MTSFDIYQLDKAEEPDPFTATHAWKRYFKLKGGLFRTFGEGMKNIQVEIDRILKKFENDKIVNYSHAKMEREYSAFRDLDKKISNDALHDSHLFVDIKTSLDNYRDEETDALILRNYEQHLKDTKKAFFDQVEKTDLIKEKYHKKAFEAEKAEIKKQISDKEAEIKKFTERFDTLKEKTETTIGKYKEEFNKLKAAGKHLRDESNKYTEAKMMVDCKRASFILDTLKTYAKDAKMKHDEVEESDFEGVRVKEVIASRLPQERVIIRKLEKYKGTKNKKKLFKQMEMELEEERNKQEEVDNDKDVLGNIEDSSIPGTSYTSGVGKIFLITTAFKHQEVSQISLSQGKIVKMIMPANSNGFAFGEKKGIFGRKIKGYFPFSHVTPAD